MERFHFKTGGTISIHRRVITFIEEENVKFIRLAFFDVFGIQKNISILPKELPRAFAEGISFDASAIDGFSDEEKSDLSSS